MYAPIKKYIREGRSRGKKTNAFYLSLDHTGSGLMVKDKYGYIEGFSIAGINKEFYRAKAYLEGDKVVVYSDAVSVSAAAKNKIS